MQSNELMTFTNEIIGTFRGFVDKDGEPWFLAGQVCRCLGIKDSSTAIKQLKQRMEIVDDWNKKRGTVSNRSPKAKTITLQDGKTHTQVTVIPEQWLYELIFASRKQSAIVFRSWVTGEVLPSIRKHGLYRNEGKLIRKNLTDTIKTEICEKTENINVKRFAYSNYTKLINKSLGLSDKVNRNLLNDEMLEKLARKENLVQALILENKSYTEIKNIIMSDGNV